jgi:hypothetical protein
MEFMRAQFRRAAAIEIAAAGLALLVCLAISGTSWAQDADPNSSDWNKVEQVLVLPSVYAPSASANDAAAASSQQPGDASAQDCNTDASNAAGDPADKTDPAANSGAVQNCAATATDESPAVQASTDDNEQVNDDLDGKLGSTQEYQDQQSAAEELNSAGVVQMPPAIIAGAPVILYGAPRAYAAPVRPLPIIRPAWMPPRRTAFAPLPPMAHGLPVFPHAAGFAGMAGFRRR